MSKIIRARTLTAVLVFASIAGAASRVAAQQTSAPLLVLLDRDALDIGAPPHAMPPESVNDLIADVGVRDQMPFFIARAGQSVTLFGGKNGSDAWFALGQVPSIWASQAGAADGLQNYVVAGAGLGSPDGGGHRDTLLYGISDVRPLGASGLQGLVGRSVCAVVYNGDIQVAAVVPPKANLNGATMGTVAFAVLGLESAAGPDAPNVVVQILDVKKTCGGALTALSDTTR